MRPSRGRDADLVLSGDHRVVAGFLLGLVELEQATADGLGLVGDAGVLNRLAVRERAA